MRILCYGLEKYLAIGKLIQMSPACGSIELNGNVYHFDVIGRGVYRSKNRLFISEQKVIFGRDWVILRPLIKKQGNLLRLTRFKPLEITSQNTCRKVQRYGITG